MKCYKFETQTDMEPADVDDLVRASSQNSILEIMVNGTTYGSGGYRSPPNFHSKEIGMLLSLCTLVACILLFIFRRSLKTRFALGSAFKEGLIEKEISTTPTPVLKQQLSSLENGSTECSGQDMNVESSSTSNSSLTSDSSSGASSKDGSVKHRPSLLYDITETMFSIFDSSSDSEGERHKSSSSCSDVVSTGRIIHIHRKLRPFPDPMKETSSQDSSQEIDRRWMRLKTKLLRIQTPSLEHLSDLASSEEESSESLPSFPQDSSSVDNSQDIDSRWIRLRSRLLALPASVRTGRNVGSSRGASSGELELGTPYSRDSLSVDDSNALERKWVKLMNSEILCELPAFSQELEYHSMELFTSSQESLPNFAASSQETLSHSIDGIKDASCGSI
jgi:hypothetical protein